MIAVDLEGKAVAGAKVELEATRLDWEYKAGRYKTKQVDPQTFERLAVFFSEREICEIVWLVASEHFYNMTNIGLNIHSDMLCDISKKRKSG